MTEQSWPVDFFDDFGIVDDYALSVDLHLTMKQSDATIVKISVKSVPYQDKKGNKCNQLLEKDIDIDLDSQDDLVSLLKKLTTLKVRWHLTIEYYTGLLFAYVRSGEQLLSAICKLSYVEELELIDGTGSIHGDMAPIFRNQRFIRKLSVAVDDNTIEQIVRMLKFLKGYPIPISLDLLYGEMTDAQYGSENVDTTDITDILRTLSKQKILMTVNIKCEVMTTFERNIRDALENDPFTCVSNREMDEAINLKTIIIDKNTTTMGLTEIFAYDSKNFGKIHGEFSILCNRMIFNDIINYYRMMTLLSNKVNINNVGRVDEMVFNSCNMSPKELFSTISDNYKTVKRLTFVNCCILTPKASPKSTNKRFITSNKE